MSEVCTHLTLDSRAVYLVVLDLAVGEAGVWVGAQPLVELRQGNLVEVDVKLLLQLVQVLLLRLGWNNFLLNPLNQPDLL